MLLEIHVFTNWTSWATNKVELLNCYFHLQCVVFPGPGEIRSATSSNSWRTVEDHQRTISYYWETADKKCRTVCIKWGMCLVSIQKYPHCLINYNPRHLYSQQVLHQRWIWGIERRQENVQGQTSPEIQNRGISGVIKRTRILQNFKKKL